MARLRDTRSKLDQGGRTLIELLTALEMQTAVDDYELDNDALPVSLAEVVRAGDGSFIGLAAGY